MTPTETVLADVAAERQRQHARFGAQNFPDGTADTFDAQAAKLMRARCDRLARNGGLTWRDLLDEEVCEVFAESDEAKLRAALVRLMARGAMWIEALDERQMRSAA